MVSFLFFVNHPPVFTVPPRPYLAPCVYLSHSWLIPTRRSSLLRKDVPRAIINEPYARWNKRPVFLRPLLPPPSRVSTRPPSPRLSLHLSRPLPLLRFPIPSSVKLQGKLLPRPLSLSFLPDAPSQIAPATDTRHEHEPYFVFIPGFEPHADLHTHVAVRRRRRYGRSGKPGTRAQEQASRRPRAPGAPRTQPRAEGAGTRRAPREVQDLDGDEV